MEPEQLIDDEEDEGMFSLAKIEKQMEDVQKQLDYVPQIFNYLPLRQPLQLNWRRSFTLRFPPRSLGDALADFRNARVQGRLANGDILMTLGLGELVLTNVALIGVGKSGVPDQYRGVAEGVTRAAVIVALQPLSHAGSWALGCEERIGFRTAFEQMSAEGAPLWNGASARVISSLSCFYVRDLVTFPMAKRAVASVFPPPQPKEQMRVFNRPTMLRRLRDCVADLYTWSLAVFSAQALTYPLECVRMRIETQFAVFHSLKYSSWLDCVRQVFVQEGLGGFYRGFHSWLLQLPAEALWPLCAWSVGALVVYVVFEEDADDDDDASGRELLAQQQNKK